MALVFKRSKGKKKFTELNKLIFGFPKTGKTTICSHMKDGDKEPLFVSTEDGAGELDIVLANIRDWEAFLKFIKYCEDNVDEVRKTHSCLIVDLVSDLDDFAANYVCRKAKVKALADLPYGAGWSQHKDEFKGAMTRLFDILPVTFVTHTKEKELNYMGQTVQTQAPTMSNRNFDFINGKVDAIGYIVPAGSDKKDKPLLSFRPTRTAIAGSRFEKLTEKDFILDFKDMEGSYLAIASHFDGGDSEKE